jgi:hypothetical protein
MAALRGPETIGRPLGSLTFLDRLAASLRAIRGHATGAETDNR